MKKLLISISFLLMIFLPQAVNAYSYEECLANTGALSDDVKHHNCAAVCQKHFQGKFSFEYNKKHLITKFRRNDNCPSNVLCECTYGFYSP